MNTSDLKTYAELIYKEKALLIKEEPFDLRSGQKSHLYLNHRDMITKGKYLKIFAKWYVQEINKHIKDCKIGCIDEVVSSLLAGAIAAETKKDVVFTFTNPLWFGTKDDLYGDLNGNIVLVDDVTSSGGTLIEAANKIRARGGNVEYAMVAAVRDETPIKKLAEAKIKLLYLATYKEVIEALKPKLSTNEVTLLNKEYELI